MVFSLYHLFSLFFVVGISSFAYLNKAVRTNWYSFQIGVRLHVVRVNAQPTSNQYVFKRHGYDSVNSIGLFLRAIVEKGAMAILGGKAKM